VVANTSRVSTPASGPQASAPAARLSSSIRPLLGEGETAIEIRHDASPLGPVAGVPVVSYPVQVGEWAATLVELTTADLASPAGAAAVAVEAHGSQTTVTVSWPDGTATTSRLAHPGSPANR
jgi:hypothetical protein